MAMQLIFGEMIFEEEPKQTTVSKIIGIIEVENEHEASFIINEIVDYDYLIPELYDGEIIYECPKLIHVNE